MCFEAFQKSSAAYGPLIREIAKYTRAKTCIEIGVAYGTTSKYICEGIKENGGHLFGFDIWSRHGVHNQFDQLSSLDESISYLQKNNILNFTLYQVDTKSSNFTDLLSSTCPIIDLAFIDGCHSYEGLKKDFENVYPKLSRHGVIIFHDTFKIDGCREFVYDLRTKYFDGTYDMVDYPFGCTNRNEGLSVLTKRMFALELGEIDELCGSPSSPAQIYAKEKAWYKAETGKFLPTKINRPKTIFSDIDGVIFKHEGDISNQHLIKPTVLDGVLKNFQEWDRRGYRIILTTGRRESTRPYTEKQLAEAGIFYDQLIMGVTGGVRILINDKKPNSDEDMAKAVNLIRNEGMGEIL